MRAAVLGALLLAAGLGARGAEPVAAAGADAGRLRFEASGGEFRFDTGAWRGTLRGGGRPVGLTALIEDATGTNVAGRQGIVSFYRMLDAEARYPDGWSWTGGAARVRADGAVEARWPADEAHPFDLVAVYRWSSPAALDIATTVTARRDLRRLEVFMASYFAGFPESRVWAKGAGGEAGFVAADEAAGVWQAFPRDDEAVAIVRDGRWARPPNAVEWAIRPPLAGPLGLRRDAATGLTALLMARPRDCFAVLTPHGAEGHRSLYLSLFGRDFKAGESATAHSRLAVGRGVTDAQAVAAYREFLRDANGGDHP